jgi:isochorismate hydrolase
VIEVPAPTPLVEWPPHEPVPARPDADRPLMRLAQAPVAAEPAPAAPPGAPPTPQVASVPPPEPAAPPATVVVQAEPTPEEREFAALLADLQRYAGLAADELRKELAAQTQALGRTRSDAVRMRVAVLHTMTRQGAQDDQRALQLFEAVVKGSPGSGAVKQLAVVLSAQVAERVRAVREEQARSEAALQKLEALRAMERSLLRDRLRSGGGGGAGSGGN